MINNNVFTVHFSNIISYVLQNHSNVGVCVCVCGTGGLDAVSGQKRRQDFSLEQVSLSDIRQFFAQ